MILECPKNLFHSHKKFFLDILHNTLLLCKLNSLLLQEADHKTICRAVVFVGGFFASIRIG